MPHILIVGAGSVGKRHLRNFTSLGCTVSATDPRPDRLHKAALETPLRSRHPTLEAAFADAGSRFDGVVICSPPNFHVDQGVAALQAGVPVLLEKPVAPNAKDASRLREAVTRTGVPLLLGYTYRWWPPLVEFRNRLRADPIGRILSVRCVMSAHLADWHPWERYQDFFMASKALGGGALLDESHFLDLMLWMFGPPRRVFAKVEKLSALEIDTDDNVDALLEYDHGLRILLHLDLYGRPHEKYILASGDSGSMRWSFDPNRIGMANDPAGNWNDTSYDCERNAMFVALARDFLGVLNGGRDLRCTIDDGLHTLCIIEAMRRSSLSGVSVEVDYGLKPRAGH